MSSRSKVSQNSISILGTGWLGLPLVKNLIKSKTNIKFSTRKNNKRLSSLPNQTFFIDIDNLSDNITSFLDSDILIINIPSKNIDSFRELIINIEKSRIKKVLFISSTSVYKNSNKVIYESDTDSLTDSQLLKIEELFSKNSHFEATIIRFGGLLDYDRNPNTFFKNKKNISNPNYKVNMIHRDDCINIITQVLSKNIWGETFNCCADTHPTKQDFYTYVAVNTKGETPVFDISNEDSFKIINSDKIKKFINYEFKYPDLMKIDFNIR